MHNIKLTIAYDGTDFHGWQIQRGQPTIQGTLTDVARKLTQEPLTVFGAGRTDAGVHALGQVAHFKTHSHLSPQEFQRAFNALLPPAIRVVAAEEVGPGFHARWQAQAKTYRYRIFRGRVVPPFACRYVLHYPYPLDEAAMAEAARLFEGEHNFASFAASSGSEEEDRDRDPMRHIFSSLLVPVAAEAGPLGGVGRDVPGTEHAAAEELVYEVRGRSFLRYMVRKIVGTLIEVGKGKLAPADITRLFEMRDRSKSGPTVPPHGLCLVSVEYREVWRTD